MRLTSAADGKFAADLLKCGVLWTQATVHRIWIADEGYYERKAAVSEAENITTIRREMEALGAPWLNILKMVLSNFPELRQPRTTASTCDQADRIMIRWSWRFCHAVLLDDGQRCLPDLTVHGSHTAATCWHGLSPASMSVKPQDVPVRHTSSQC